MRKVVVYVFLIAFAMSGCREYKELIYFDELGDVEINNPASQDEKDYLLRVNDILYIRVISLNEQLNEVYNTAAGSSVQSNYMQYQESGMYYNGFRIRDDGIVDLPQIGNVKVVGLTADEAKVVIQEKASEFLKDATIIVKLANQRFTLLGEVQRPGTYLSYNSQTTILDALGLAGDMTDYGDRKNVLIIRPTLEGAVTHRINLNDKSALSSPYYYLKPNDIVYIQPVKAKKTRLLAQDAGVFLSIWSSAVATASIIFTIIFNLKK